MSEIDRESKDVETAHNEEVNLQRWAIRSYGGKKDYDYLVVEDEKWLWGNQENAVKFERYNAKKLQKIIAFNTFLESV